MSTLLKIQFSVTADQMDECTTFLSTKVPHGWEEEEKDGLFNISLFLEDHPLGMELVREITARWPEGNVKHNEQESEDWAMAWKDFFNPVACGERFEILAPWQTDDAEDGKTHIIIEPKMAFGTGHHPTTSLCLALIGDLANKRVIEKGMEFLDLGTGSGILGIGLCKLGLNGFGLDIDPQAIVCARENAEINETPELQFAVGSIDCLEQGRAFDVVVANILSGPLIEMAGDIKACVKSGGSLILSGILVDQGDAVAAAYMRAGLPEPERTIDGEWIALLWENVA